MVGEGVQRVSVLNFKLDGRCMLFYIPFLYSSVKNLPAMWENQVHQLSTQTLVGRSWDRKARNISLL